MRNVFLHHILRMAMLVLPLIGGTISSARVNHALEVNPFIGTDYQGNTYPGAQVPHGLVQLSPDNGLPGWDRIAGYFYPDSTIAGFSHTHLSGTGAGDLYDISFMPVSDPVRKGEAPLGVYSRFSHSGEDAHAGYYKVHLDDYDIDVELTATEHCGIQRYRWPGSEGKVILNLAKAMNWDSTVDTGIEVVDSLTIRGWRFSNGWARDQKVWFETRFSSPFTVIADEEPTDGVATFSFRNLPDGVLTVVTAISGTDAEGASCNIRMEAPHDDFDLYLARAEENWNRLLEKIDIETDSQEERSVFYTALYHSLLAPVVFSDADGRFRGPDGRIHRCRPGHRHYSTFSLWDTYRAAHPLYTIIEPDAAGDMAESLVYLAVMGDRLPVWPMWASETDMMIGYHSAPVIVDAILKGITDIDPKQALEECVRTARTDSYRSIGDYRRLGFVPCDTDTVWSLSKTLEYAFDDHCIALLAERLGREDIRSEFAARAKNYVNQFNPGTGFMQPRRSDGGFVDDFDPKRYTEDVCESNPWQYLWSVQHDIPGLVALSGGKREFEKRLDRFFTEGSDSISLPIFSTGMIGQYAHGNEPSHHVAYLYGYTDHPEKGDERLLEIMTRLYRNAPDGLCGNEDCGQMSAWYVFSALGFYPVNPVGGEYLTGVPLFRKATVHLDNGKRFTIRKGTGESRRTPVVTHAEIMNGGTLNFK